MLQLISRFITKRREAHSPPFDATMRDWFRFIEASGQRKGHEVIAQCKRDLLPRFGSRPLDAIQKREIAQAVEECLTQRGPYAAQHLLSYCGRFYRWCGARGLTEHNPAAGLTTGALIGNLESRDRTLSEAELRAIWQATAFGDPHDAIVRLLLVTAARREEIGGLRSAELNYSTRQIELPKARTKQKRPHIIPLSPLALSLLPPTRPSREFVFGKGGRSPFSGWSRAKERLNARCGFSDWRLHDLRRTAITLMNERQLGPPWIIEQFVGHVTARTGVAAIYDRSSNLEARRELADRWSEELGRMVGL